LAVPLALALDLHEQLMHGGRRRREEACCSTRRHGGRRWGGGKEAAAVGERRMRDSGRRDRKEIRMGEKKIMRGRGGGREVPRGKELKYVGRVVITVGF
jgi:hypothetical protein